MRPTVLKPGLLVSLKTSIRGGVAYKRVDLEPERDTEEGRVSRWETTRHIPDPKEYERAMEVRSKARSMIATVCCPSSFGFLCPSDREADLTQAIEEARDLTNAFNAQARESNVMIYVLAGRVARDDVEAAKAISSEIRELMDAMQAGIEATDPEAIRVAANKARALGAMLSADVQTSVSDAIDEARKAAREIVKRIEKQGENAQDVLRDLTTWRIERARTAFLDMDEGTVSERVAVAGRAVEMDRAGGTDTPAVHAKAAANQLEF